MQLRLRKKLYKIKLPEGNTLDMMVDDSTTVVQIVKVREISVLSSIRLHVICLISRHSMSIYYVLMVC